MIKDCGAGQKRNAESIEAFDVIVADEVVYDDVILGDSGTIVAPLALAA